MRQRQARTCKSQQDGGRGRKAGRRLSKPSVVEDDNMSVMTGMIGAMVMHSVLSQPTSQMNNTRVPMSIGGGDNMSVVTGVRDATGNWGCCY